MLTQDQAKGLKDTYSKNQDRLRGRMCGLIESMGLPEKQERAAISLVKAISYDSDREIVEMLYRATLE